MREFFSHLSRAQIMLGLFLLPVFAVVLYFSYSAYSYYNLIHADGVIKPYLEATKGRATIIRQDTAYDLDEGDTYPIKEKDIVEVKQGAIATLHWPDQSVSRIGDGARLEIREMYTSKNLEDIRISMSLQRGKIWSNVIRAFFGDSYFETRIPNQSITAAVRGTVFEVNLDKNYIHSVNHAVKLEQKLSGILGTARENTVFSGQIVATTNILEYLKENVLDREWLNINSLYDNKLLSERLQAFQSRMKQLSGGARSVFDSASRALLTRFDAFSDLEVARSITTGGTSIKKASEASLVRLYQSMANLDVVEEKAKLRSTMEDIIDPKKFREKYLETLTTGAIWDMVGPGGSAQKEIGKFLDRHIGALRDPSFLRNMIKSGTLQPPQFASLQKLIQSQFPDLMNLIKENFPMMPTGGSK